MNPCSTSFFIAYLNDRADGEKTVTPLLVFTVTSTAGRPGLPVLMFSTVRTIPMSPSGVRTLSPLVNRTAPIFILPHTIQCLRFVNASVLKDTATFCQPQSDSFLCY